MLDQYILQTQQLLQNPGAPTPLYSTADLTSYINRARGQVAGEQQCCLVPASLALLPTTFAYPFTAINHGTVTGSVAGTFNVKSITVDVGGSRQFVSNVPYEWFNQYYLSSATAAFGAPQFWAQFGQGSFGTIYFFPTPAVAMVANVDESVYPFPLVTDSDAEIIPYQWTDAVPYFAAFLALMSAQTGNRQQQAQGMYALYKEFAARARVASTPASMPFQFDYSSLPNAPSPAGIPAPNASK
jgi:hypothetical protein